MGRPAIPLLVLLHGGGTDHRCWAPLLPHLDGFDLRAPDLPGHGDRPLPADVSVEGVAAALAPEIDAMVGGAPHAILGHSFGGMVAMVLAARRAPDRLILADTFAKPAAGVEAWLRIAAMQAGAALAGHRRATGAVLREWGIGRHGTDGIVRASMLHPHALSLPAMMGTVRRFDGRPLLPRIGCPTLCLMAGRNAATQGAGAAMAARLPDARVEEVDADHMLMRDDPAGTAAAIRRFLA